MEQGSKKIKVVHRNLLLSLPWARLNDSEVSVTKVTNSVSTGSSDTSRDSSQSCDEATLTAGPLPVEQLSKMQ